MRFFRFFVGQTAAVPPSIRASVLPSILAVTVATIAMPAGAANVLYNFNASDGGWTVTSGSLTPTATPWTWTPGPSVTEGGWQAWRGNDPADSGTYLVSPCLIIDDVDGEYVRMDIRHRFDFGPAESPLALGQVQYRINDGDWFGIRTSDFLATSGKIPPSYSSPPNPPFIDSTSIPSGGPYAVEAWVGTTDKFIQGDHQDSQFTLDFDPSATNPYPFVPGDEIQFRFLMGPLADISPTVIDWEINKVQIDGVYECPEPGGIALAAIGGGLLILGSCLRHRRWLGAMQRSAAAGAAAAAIAVAWLLLAGSPAKADTVVTFDFQTGSKGWIPSTQGGLVPSANRWTYYASGSSSDPRWGVKAMGVGSVSVATAAHLRSPLISGTLGDGDGGSVAALSARISLAHNFLLPPSGTGGPRPITTGQLSYRLNNSGTWIGLPLSAFTSGGDLNVDNPVFGPSPFKNDLDPLDPFYVDQTSFVAPTYLTPTGTSSLPWVAPGGASFVRQSNGWSSLYVPSQAFLTGSILPPGGITSLKLRLTNANFGGNCNDNEGWNVRFVQIDFSETDPPVPEPGTLALAAMGVGGVLAARALTRRSPPALQTQ